MSLADQYDYMAKKHYKEFWRCHEIAKYLRSQPRTRDITRDSALQRDVTERKVTWGQFCKGVEKVGKSIGKAAEAVGKTAWKVTKGAVHIAVKSGAAKLLLDKYAPQYSNDVNQILEGVDKVINPEPENEPEREQSLGLEPPPKSEEEIVAKVKEAVALRQQYRREVPKAPLNEVDEAVFADIDGWAAEGFSPGDLCEIKGRYEQAIEASEAKIDKVGECEAQAIARSPWSVNVGASVGKYGGYVGFTGRDVTHSNHSAQAKDRSPWGVAVDGNIGKIGFGAGVYHREVASRGIDQASKPVLPKSKPKAPADNHGPYVHQANRRKEQAPVYQPQRYDMTPVTNQFKATAEEYSNRFNY
jgi:hypothetical protein